MRTPDVAARQDSSVTSHGPRTKLCTQAFACTAVVQGGAHKIIFCVVLCRQKSCVFQSHRKTIGFCSELRLTRIYLILSIPPGLSREIFWRETLFLCLVQNESKPHRLISICTKPRKSFSRQFFLEINQVASTTDGFLCKLHWEERSWRCNGLEGKTIIFGPFALCPGTTTRARPPRRRLWRGGVQTGAVAHAAITYGIAVLRQK